MSEQQIDLIETNKIDVLSEFPAAGWIEGNRVRFRIGRANANIVIASCGTDEEWFGSMLFERGNLEAVTKLLDDVLRGRLRKENKEYLGLNAGKDRIGISAQMPRERLTISIYNNRLANIDGLETTAWDLTVSPDTALKFNVEMERLVLQGV